MMDKDTRGNILAGVQNTLHTMNTGLVREMISGTPNCSPQDILDGKWIFINFPPSVWGDAGRLISVGWKQLVEQAILEREVDNNSPFVTIWGDESHQCVTNFDSSFIAQCRSHRGCLVYLTQSVSSFYAAMGGFTGKHKADALLANFSHTIIHASDPTTAQWASSKLGKMKEMFFGGGMPPRHAGGMAEELFGHQQVSGNFSEHYEPVVQEKEFMIGRTGGPMNGFLTDAIVIRSGEPFAHGKHYLRAVFSQRG
jgi:hypothetical protein